MLSNSPCFLLCFKHTFCCYNLQFFLHLKPFKVFSCITSLQKGSLGPLLVFLHFIPIFCIKSYKRVFWSFPAMEPIFQSLHLSLSLFQLVCANYLFNSIQKPFVSASESACVSLSRFSPQGYFGLFTLFKFWAERYFKIPHFGNLFVLVRCCHF